jgi:hypothetical protein
LIFHLCLHRHLEEETMAVAEVVVMVVGTANTK